MRTPAAILACTMLLVLQQATAAVADQVAIVAAKDNTLYESSDASLSNGVGQFFFSGNTRDDLRRRAVIAFDIAAHVPGGATITSAALELHVSMHRGGTHASTLHRLSQDWGEGNSNSLLGGGGQGAVAAPNDATWLYTFFSTGQWTTPGGDFVEPGSASTMISGKGSVLWSSTATMVADIQGWLESPTTNYGWIVVTDESERGTAKRFDSRESITEDHRPVLVITYEGSPVQSATWGNLKALFR